MGESRMISGTSVSYNVWAICVIGMTSDIAGSASHARHAAFGPDAAELEISVVMPCLNERDTVRVCIGKALAALKALGLRGEVIVADNGSTDGSQGIAQALGARVVAVQERGYGSALRGGLPWRAVVGSSWVTLTIPTTSAIWNLLSSNCAKAMNW